jgi:MFS family permease
MLLGASLSGVALLGTWASLQWAAAYADKLVERQDGFSELPTVEKAGIKARARAYTQAWSAVGAIIGTMLAAVAGHRFGRRITYFFMCLASFLAVVVLYQNTSFGPQFLVSVFAAGGLTATFYGWLPLYLPELFNTHVRATGQGFAFNFGRIIAAVGALQTGALFAVQGRNIAGLELAAGYPFACTMMSLIYVVGMFLIWIAPETRGKPLPE